MATIKRSPKKPKLFDLQAMTVASQKEVDSYYSLVNEINRMIASQPFVNRQFIAEACIDKFNVTDEWFTVMQEYHKQYIIDSVKGRNE